MGVGLGWESEMWGSRGRGWGLQKGGGSVFCGGFFACDPMNFSHVSHWYCSQSHPSCLWALTEDKQEKNEVNFISAV